MSAGSYDATGAVVLADFSAPDASRWKRSAAAGVAFSGAADSGPTNAPARPLTVTNAGRVPQNAAWARLEQRFEPCLNLKDRRALGLWIEGDGLGETVAIRLESPHHLAYGAIADRYITVDFTGRRLFALVETESSRWNDFVWNDGKALYNVYRETIDFGAVETVSVWYQNLPAAKEVNCRFGPVKALPMVSGTVRNPVVTVNGLAVEFPVELASGSWLECRGSDDCTLYGSKGEVLAQVTPRGVLPTLRAGENEIQFFCASAQGPSPRVRVTVFSLGEGL